MHRLLFRAWVATLALVVFVGCGGVVDPDRTEPSGRDGPPSIPSAPVAPGSLPAGEHYLGTMAGAGQSGILDLTLGGVATERVATASARLSPGGNIALRGTFVKNVLTLSGGGYTFDGLLRADVRFGLGGTYAGPTPGTGGSFTLQSAAEGPATIFCGTFSGPLHGVWNFVAGPTKVTGSASQEGDAALLLPSGSLELHGTRRGSTIFIPLGPWGPDASATGTITGTSASGTWSDANDSAGTWTGRAGGCP